jgi:diacylglycerol kinase (ATP)
MRNKFLGTGTPGYHPARKVLTVISGLRYAVLYDASVAYKLVLSAVVLVAAFVVVAEMFNSAIEALCDFVEVRHNERIKVIKDIAAAAVGLTIVVWIVVLAVEAARFWPALAGATSGVR